MLAKRIKEGLLSALREEIMEEGLDEMLDEMQEENTDSKSEVVAESTNEVLAVKSFSKPPAVCAESFMAVKTMQAVVGELRRGKRIKIGKKMFGE
jgi:hypothetical protein